MIKPFFFVTLVYRKYSRSDRTYIITWHLQNKSNSSFCMQDVKDKIMFHMWGKKMCFCGHSWMECDIFSTKGANNGQWIAPPGSGITPHLPLTIPGQNVWLFNITADPYEEMELSEKYPTVVKTLLAKLDTYYKDSVPVIYPDDSDQANPALHNGTWAPWEWRNGLAAVVVVHLSDEMYIVALVAFHY